MPASQPLIHPTSSQTKHAQHAKHAQQPNRQAVTHGLKFELLLGLILSIFLVSPVSPIP